METAEVLLTLGTALIAFWRRDSLLYVIAGIMLILFGIQWAETTLGIGVMVAILGGYCFWKAIERQMGRA